MAVSRLKERSKSGAEQNKKRHAATGTAIELSDLATALTDAVLVAKRRLDEDTVAVANQYRAHRILRFLPPPAFAIGEVRLVIKFAIARTESAADGAKRAPRRRVYVHVDAASLSEMAPHLVSEIELRIAPEMTRAAATEAERNTSE